MMRRFVTRATMLPAPAASLLAASCTMGPDFLRPAAPTETHYTPAATEDKAAGEQHFKMGEKITGDWWSLYRSDPLHTVVRQSIEGNRTLVAAQATLAAAQEAVIQARGPLFPQVDLNA